VCPSWYRFTTVAGALAVVNSVLIGGAPGLAVQAGTGTLAGDGALAGYLARQRATWRGAAASVCTTASR
jgi:hypothetical protein